MKVELKLSNNQLRIYIDGLIHVNIRLDELVGIQSWEQGGLCYIEFYLKTTFIKCEYNKPELWKEILKVLEDFEYS